MARFASSPLSNRQGPISLLMSGFSVRAVEQAARNNLGLDLGSSFKNIEDAGIAQDSGNREFQRKAVAAMHLHGVVCGSPGDTRRQQLGHPGFQVAAPSGIFFARGIIRELPRDHYFHRHHHDLVGNAREPDDWTAE